MLWIILSCVLAAALGCTLSIRTGFTEANQDQNGSAQNVRQAIKDIKDIGEGYQSRINVTLKDGTKLEGYVSTIADDYFAVTNVKTARTVKVGYGDVAKVVKQKPPRRASQRPLAAIIGGISIVVFAFVAYAIADRER
jgi:hypothetical protein